MNSKKRIIKIILIMLILSSSVIFLMANFTFAAGNCAFSAGGNFASKLAVEDAVLNAKTYYSNMGYSSYYSIVPTQSIITGYFKNGTRRLESDIVFLDGHGSYQSIMVSDGVGVGMTRAAELPSLTSDFNWGNTKLVVLLACYTGQDINLRNITYDIWERSGYKNVSIGWKQEIFTNSSTLWANRFNYRLSTGGTLRNAIDYANGFSDYPESSIKDLAFYGEWGTVLKHSSNVVMSEMPLDTIDNVTYINDNIEFNGNEETMNNIIDLMNEQYNNFNINNFEVSVYSLDSTNQNFTIDLHYKVGDCYTNQGYVVAVEDGKVSQITNNMTYNVLQPLSINSSEITEEKIEEIKLEAVNDLRENLSDEDKEKLSIIKQKYKKILDTDSNTVKIVVSTVYTLDNISVGGASYEYQL